VLAAATAWERVFHGNPSGIDTAVAAFGGCLWFTKAEGATPIVLGAPLSLAIAVAAPPASTKAMVESVARLKERRPTVVEKALEGIRSLVRNARLALEAGDVPGLGGLLDLNHMILAGLHLSTEELEHARQIARDAGALGAKLTGAGGGGSVIALCDGDADPVLAAWRKHGIQCFFATVT
jgi:mevalonate kinase